MPRYRRAFALFALPLMVFVSATSAQAEKNLTRPSGTTRYAPMVARLQALLAYDHRHGEGRMTLRSLGTSVKGRALWLVTLHEGQNGSAKRLFYLCRQHGHEPASTEGALDFIETLVRAAPDTLPTQWLKEVTIFVVPMANPDGSEAFLRHNARDVDLNRDWLNRTQPETRALYRSIMRLRPDVMTDQHELYPDDGRQDFTETAATGSGAAPGVIAACAALQNVIAQAMPLSGAPTAEHWIDDRHPPRLAHRYGCVVAGIPTILFETNRLAGSGRSLAARAAAHTAFMTIVLRAVAGESDQLLSEAAAWRASHYWVISPHPVGKPEGE